MSHTNRSIPLLRAAATAGAAVICITASASAQRGNVEPLDLHGSKSSVEKMYDFATSHRMQFYLTPENLDAGIVSGHLVPLTGDSTYELTRGVGFSYATREARDFVTELAPQYLAACGTPLTVTSAARPTSRQPHNANPHSVHPTGIAVDLRRPSAGPCLNWIRGALATLEEKGMIEATEEHHPVHLHIAVLTEPGAKLKLPVLYAGAPVPRVVIPDSIAPLPARALSAEKAAAAAASAIATFARMGMEGGDYPSHIRSARSLIEIASSGDVALATKGASSTPGSGRVAMAAHTYRVRQGDTLWEVAQRNGVSVRTLAAANHIPSRRALRPGLTLQLPAGR